METIAPSLDHFDLVIETFQTAVVDRMIAMIEQAVGVAIQHLCELPNVEEVEDQAVWYPIRMKSTGSHTYRKIGWMS
jgi:hypothetical protein